MGSLQSLSFALCHLCAQTTCSVSIPAPLYCEKECGRNDQSFTLRSNQMPRSRPGVQGIIMIQRAIMNLKSKQPRAMTLIPRFTTTKTCSNRRMKICATRCSTPYFFMLFTCLANQLNNPASCKLLLIFY
jgi:hypothetical protein